jgi:hypothetical protein
VNRRRFLIFLLVAVGVGALARKLSTPIEGTRFTLANGDQLVFRATTFGSNTTHCYGNIFQRLAAGLPGRIGKTITGDTMAEAWSRRHSDFVAWFTFRGTGDPMDLQFRITDDHGLDAAPDFEERSFWLSAGETGFLLQGGALPRRARNFKLRVLEKMRVIGELKINNPFHRDFPRWTPEPMPVTRRIGSFAVTLDALAVAMDSEWSALDLQNQYGNSATFGLRLTDSGKLTDHWAFFGARVSDPTDNFPDVWTVFLKSQTSGYNEFIGKWPIWPGETVVKLQTLWVPKDVQPPERVVVFYGIPVPSPRPPSFILVSTNHPMGEFSISCKGEAIDSSNNSLLELWSGDARFYNYAGTNVECYYFQAARDEKGRDLERLSPRQFRLPADSKSVDLAIHLPVAKRVDFVVSPKLVSAR